MKDMAIATNSGALRYHGSPMLDQFGRQRGTGWGRLLAVEETEDGTVVLVLSIGKADGVWLGDEFRVSRGSKFVGFVRVTRLYKDKSIGEFDAVNAGSGAPPQTNDRCSGN
jgi:hypothetical protein